MLRWWEDILPVKVPTVPQPRTTFYIASAIFAMRHGDGLPLARGKGGADGVHPANKLIARERAAQRSRVRVADGPVDHANLLSGKRRPHSMLS